MVVKWLAGVPNEVLGSIPASGEYFCFIFDLFAQRTDIIKEEMYVPYES